MKIAGPVDCAGQWGALHVANAATFVLQKPCLQSPKACSTAASESSQWIQPPRHQVWIVVRRCLQVLLVGLLGWTNSENMNKGASCTSKAKNRGNVGALIIRIWLWGILNYNYNKEPPKLHR